MRDVNVTVVGNVGGDPVVRETSRGRVSNFTLGATRRVWDREAAGWVDGPTSWFRVACWNQLGANVAESVRRGERVVVVGRLEIRGYADRDGVERVRAEIQADHVGHELSFGVTRFMRVLRSPSPTQTAAAEPDDLDDIPDDIPDDAACDPPASAAAGTARYDDLVAGDESNGVAAGVGSDG